MCLTFFYLMLLYFLLIFNWPKAISCLVFKKSFLDQSQFSKHKFVKYFDLIGKAKNIIDEDPFYNAKIYLFSFTWAGLAAFHKSDKI